MTTTAPSRTSIAQRLRGVSGEVVKFGVVGLIGVFVNFGVSNAVLHLTGWAPVRCSVTGTAVAIAANYLGYRYWVYRDSDAASRRREITLFLIFSGIGMLIENGTVWFTTYTLGLTGTIAYNLSKVVGTGLGTLFRFFSYRTWVFKAIPELPEDAGTTEDANTTENANTTGAEPVVIAQAERLLAGDEIEYANK